MKIGRNQICPLCNTGKKYKKCCGNPLNEKAHLKKLSINELPKEARQAFEQNEADELVRQQQQGLGKPIVSFENQGHQIVAVGNKLRFSPKWKTFPDFLSDNIKIITTGKWGNGEISKPYEDRHPLLQWYQKYCDYQKKNVKVEGEVYSAPAIGVANCYLGLAYSLYLLEHNVELHTYFVERLKHLDQFQGAYYELIVINILIRAGFTIELEDEADESTKHCEFIATSQTTGKKYWVEAKMRVVEGALGNGKNTSVKKRKKEDPTSRITKQLNDALNKPADGERLIFIDVNASSKNDGTMPAWINKAIRRLDDKEKKFVAGQEAYIFVTNVPFHHHLNEEKVELALYAHGLGISDFGKPGEKRLTQAYKEKKKHIDAYNIVEHFRKYPHIPQNFDGSLSEVTKSERLIIGKYYTFKDLEKGDLTGELTTATVDKVNKQIICAIYTSDDKSHIVKRSMNNEELEDYENHPEAFFGKVQHVGKKMETPYELFEFFINAQKDISRQNMLEFFKNSQDIENLESLNKEDLFLTYCEALVAAVINKGSS